MYFRCDNFDQMDIPGTFVLNFITIMGDCYMYYKLFRIFYSETKWKNPVGRPCRALISSVETKTIPKPGATNEVEKVDMREVARSDCRT